jgi:radical SAM superfamily enzyme YgiQ (UPF0313 family)
MRVLLVIAPMTQLNTAYPSTAFLTGFLRSRGVDTRQDDLSLRVFEELTTRDGLSALRDELNRVPSTPDIASFLGQFDRYIATIGPALRFLQGRDPALAHRIASRDLLPEGPAFDRLEAFDGDDPLEWAFGSLGHTERAKHLATLFVNDVAAMITAVDPRFGLVRYAERLAASQGSYDALAAALAAPGTLVDRVIDRVAAELVARHEPDLLGVSAPFAGNAYGAFRVAQAAKRARPGLKVALGGGFVNTELRELGEPRVFDSVDYVVRDDGELPLLRLIEHVEGRIDVDGLRRTFVREGAQVRYVEGEGADVPFAETGTPTWDGLPLTEYPSILEMLNPMHRLWSDGRWNKALVAKGCYWKKCSFCDVSLPYISQFEAANASTVVDRMEAAIAETGQTGFHFVDEAAPPKSLRALAEEILRRGLVVSWWGNIRFEKTFTPELCTLLADSGCIGVTGGLEVASDRLLAKMQKGVTIAQVARVSRAFSDVGVLVHAYLMYGFPTQTVQETVDSLEIVRQLFEEGCLQSAFWHRFTATVHSPVGLDPAAFGVRVVERPDARFARNDLDFEDPTGVDHDALGVGLDRALYNFMHGLGFDQDVRAWFGQKVPRPSVRRDVIRKALAE